MKPLPAPHPLLNRRAFLADAGLGLGAIALTHLLGTEGLLGASVSGLTPIRPVIDPAMPFAPRSPHFAPRAKNVLVIFCSGACSHLDTFDYKPELIRRHGRPLPGGEQLITFQGEQGAITRSPWEFKPRGRSGKMVSELLPHLAECVDDLCFIHSMQGKTNTHGPGENFMSTGFTLDGFPSIGAWVTYALGSVNQDLKQRGLLRDTLVVWCTEFGRMPTFQKGTEGRDHNPHGLTCWLAGAGVRAPFSYGATDEFGYRAVQDIVDVHDLHATVLHLLGLNHERLTFYHNGLERRLTDVHGEIVEGILA